MFFLTLGKSGSFLEKPNMMILTKEATDKDNNSDEKLNGERVWRIEGYFPDIRPKLNLEKKNIPVNCLLYINQSYL